MLCDECHKDLATVHLTKIMDDETTELHLCEECTRRLAGESSLNFFFTFPKLLADVLDLEDPQSFAKLFKESLFEGESTLSCSTCGTTFSDIRESGKLGCGECYEVFRARLIPILEKIHGSCQYAGKVPRRAEGQMKTRLEIRTLRRRLEELVKREEYEKAAEIRDRIKDLEGKLAASLKGE
ncbi:MAG: UvrB/UvrC motif-containing protein [Actinomycetota bacterium]|nr:UvrB/UvrC motif-containing protein [Actinomycetota bacterium]